MTYTVTRHKVETNGYTNVQCDRCDIELKPAIPVIVDEDGVWECLQPDKALTVRLSGGYGMFIDEVGTSYDHDGLFVLCVECAKRLMDENPWMESFLQTNIHAEIGHLCDYDDRFVWVSYRDCMRSNTHGRSGNRRSDG